MRKGLAIAGAALSLVATLLTFVLDVRLRDLGRTDLASLDSSGIPFLIAMAATVGVGLVLALRTTHPVGPLFVWLGFAICASGTLDQYDRLSLLAAPDDYPGSRWVLSLDEWSFAPWMVLISAVLLVTPSGRLPSPRWRPFLVVATTSALTLLVTRTIVPGTFEKPYTFLHHPVELDTHGVLDTIRMLGGVIVSVVPLVAGVSLVRRWRASSGDERQQLRWVGYGATLTALGLAATAVAAYSERDELTVLAGVSLTFLPITTGIAVLRYRLYDLDQLISRTVTYLLVTAILVGVWAAGVLAVSTAISSRVDSALPASAATLAVAALAIPLLRRVREVVDRRFRRRRHDALATIRAWVSRPAGEAASVSVEEVLRQALREDAVQVDFWLDDRAEWVDAEGRPRGSAGLEVGRGPARIARVSGIAESPLLHEVCAAALPELEAAQLRVALQARITELSESRERLSTIAVEERRRLERDLHDGAQQRLLSVLFDLETAQRHGAPLSGAIEQTRVALAELRDLAHGLRPTALHDDGLVEAVEGLVDRCPVPTSLHLGSDIPALSEDVESAAYYVVAEALANATKHAAATAICVDLRVLDGSLVVSVKDDGRGGADPLGNGLRGLADRAEVVGGRLTISDDCGTQVQVELPCA